MGLIFISSATRSLADGDAPIRNGRRCWQIGIRISYGWNAADFGWGADRLQNILWRIQNGELDGVNPKVIVILAGTNNVGNRPGSDEKIADILKGFDALIATCREKAPSARIILTAIFPRNDNPAVLPEIRRINDQLAKLADGQTIFYINVNDKLADANWQAV